MAHVLTEEQMMERHESYHRSISGEEAERRLNACGNHCYLTRYSENRRCYVLSVYQKKPVPITKHFRICVDNTGDSKMYRVEGKTLEFKGMEALLREYETNPIDPAFMTIGRPITEAEYQSKPEQHNCTIQ